jgi:nitronate monooxygenase
MSGLRTSLCETVDIDHPVIQAPIGSVSCPALAAAVSNAGGLGTLAVTWRDIEETRAVIEETRARTEEPFGVNLVLDPAARQRPTEPHLEACLDAGVDVVSFSFGDGSRFVERVHDAGALVFQTVGSVEEAETAVAAGVDVLVAQGWEAGGHVQSEVATMPLVPQVADVASGEAIPVVAAGGIADGRGVAAALALGADGVWLGTRFVAAEEAAAHQRYKAEVESADSTATVYSRLFDEGWPGTSHRTLTNSTVEEWLAAGKPPAGERPGEGEPVARDATGEEIVRYGDDPPLPETEGNVEALPMYAGQSTGLATDVEPAAEIVRSLVEEGRNRIGTVAEYLDRAE